MSSVKCANCGLVNLFNDQQCKRCRMSLGGNQTNWAQFQASHLPPPPPVFTEDGIIAAHAQTDYATPPCIKCGDRQNVSIKSFVKCYNPPAVILAIFFSPLVYVILRLILKTTHKLTAPFCGSCWSRFRNVEIYGVFNLLGFFALIVGGIIFAVATDSEWLLLAGILFPFLIFAVVKYYLSSVSPKYKRVNSREVVIDAPSVGEIVYTK